LAELIQRLIDGAALLLGLIDRANRIFLCRRLDGDRQGDIAHIGGEAVGAHIAQPLARGFSDAPFARH
jgi:hypothetical protein